MNLIHYIETQLVESKKIPAFKAGDTITVHYKIKEGDKERIQQYQGLVIQRRGSGASATFTVRKISNGVGVERIFPLYSPFIDKIELNKVGVVRRAKLYYIRQAKGKKGRVEEKQQLGGKDRKETPSATVTTPVDNTPVDNAPVVAGEA